MGAAEGEGESAIEMSISVRVLSANGRSMNESEIVSKLDEGKVEDAESSLREGLALNFEEARALLGRLEYQRGKIEAALRVFHGVDLQAAIERLQQSPSEKQFSRRARSRESLHANPQPSFNLMLEALYLKAASLQQIGKADDAALECNALLDAVEKIIQNGPQDLLVDIKLHESITKAVELLPELLKEAGKINESLASYRRALLFQWNLGDEITARIQKRFAVLLLYGGVEADPPSLIPQDDNSMFIPKNNIEEAILLLMMLLSKWHLGKIPRDPSLIEHLAYALCICDQTSFLAKQFEELEPETYHRCDRWNTLALCYSGAGEDMTALNLLRKSLNKLEKPNKIQALLLASKICGKDCLLASEGAEYARRAAENSLGASDTHMESTVLRFLGICLGKQAKGAASDIERSHSEAEALKSLGAAMILDRSNPDLVYDLSLEYAENHDMNAALRCAKEFIDATGGSVQQGWRLLVLILSAQQRFREAEVVTEAALDETARLEQEQLLRIKAKLKVAQSLYMEAIETYRILLALFQSRRKAASQIEADKSNESEVWQDLANLYSRLSHRKDAEICIEKARELRPYSASALQTEGFMHEAVNQSKLAMVSYMNALLIDGSHAASKVAIGTLLWKLGSESLVAARSFLADALRLEPSNQTAWYYLGMLHKHDGRFSDAADCFQAASMLQHSQPVHSFATLSP